MRQNRVMSLHLVLLVVVILQCASANPVGPTGPVIEAEGWTPVRSSQVVRVPLEYVKTNQADNPLPPSVKSHTENKVKAPQSQPETPISISQTPCTIKNGVCVPKCSELSEEQLLQGVQCALESSPIETEWEAVQTSSTHRRTEDFLAQQIVQPNNNNIIASSEKQGLKQEGESCGSCFCPPTYTAGSCAPGLECKRDPRIPDSPGKCARPGYLVNQAETFDSAEELEIQRQQSEYSGFGDKIPENGENIIPQQQDRVPTENPYSTSLGEGEAIESYSSLDPLSEDQAIRIVPVKASVPEKPPMIIYPQGSDQYQPPPRKENENEERVVVQTASVVPLDENLVRKRVPPTNQQGQFPPINHPRAPHLRPHPPNRPPPHHPQTQPRRGPVRIKPRRPGPPKRISNTIQGVKPPQRPIISGRPPLPPPPLRRPQPEAAPRSDIARPSDQFISTQINEESLSQGRQQRPPSIESRQEPRQVANVASQGAPTPPEPAARRPLKPRQQPPPNRPRPRPIRPRPTRGRPQKGIFSSVKDAVNRAKCEATKFVSKQMLNDERFIQTQINCVLDKGECDETGAMIKRLAPDVLSNKCPAPCTPCKRQQIKMMMSTIQRKHPALFADVMRQMKNRN